MLSEQERQEMLEMARSPQIREEFRRLEAARAKRPVDVEAYIHFLSAMSRILPLPPPRPLVPYTRVLL